MVMATRETTGWLSVTITWSTSTLMTGRASDGIKDSTVNVMSLLDETRIGAKLIDARLISLRGMMQVLACGHTI